VVEHASNQAAFLQSCLKFVKPKTGYFFLSTIARTQESYFLTILSKSKMHVNPTIVAENVLQMVPKGTHEWDLYMNPEEVEGIVQPYGFTQIAKSGVMINNPLTLEMGELPWLRSNYMLMFRRLV
jgi:2-polyprenyl-6-hydroxyphenyl methylase / 3-demethylubiquinone-9 3-methyltransferase